MGKWSSDASNKLVQCPVTGCGHIGQIITKAHFKIHHDITRDEAEKRFGEAISVTTKELVVDGRLIRVREK